MTDLRLKVEGVRVQFGGTIALDGVDLAVYPGEVLALIGENGAGKSTLMKVLSGVVRPQTGNMVLDGQTYAPQNPKEARSRGVAMIYQELALAPSLTVRENIFLGMEPTKSRLLDKKQMKDRATTALLELGHKVDIDLRVNTLSISDQQLVEIARASAASARVLIFDEPTSSITSKDVEKLFTLIVKLKEQGQAIIYISHFLEELKEIDDRFVVLRDGKSVADGLMKDVSKDDLLQHDERAPEPSLAFLLSRMRYPDFPEPLGVFRAVEKDRYVDIVRGQIAQAVKKDGVGDLQKLVSGNETWKVE